MVLELHFILLIYHNAFRILKIIHASWLAFPRPQRYLLRKALYLEFYTPTNLKQMLSYPLSSFSLIPVSIFTIPGLRKSMEMVNTYLGIYEQLSSGANRLRVML